MAIYAVPATLSANLMGWPSISKIKSSEATGSNRSDVAKTWAVGDLKSRRLTSVLDPPRQLASVPFVFKFWREFDVEDNHAITAR